MRPTITWLLVLVIASMLVGTALADCAAIAMPCCSQHPSTNCHEICATPTGNISSAAVPQFAGEFQTVATVSSVIPVPRFLTAHVQLALVPSTENLLTRIHVLLI
jgi:hypothetical protein